MDDVGVACAEPAGDCDDEPAWGEAVPEEESFFLILLPSLSFALESCSDCQR